MIIEFKKSAWQKINLYIKHADGEISGLGVSTLNEAGNFIKVLDVGIWNQTCSGAGTEVISHEETLKLASEFIKQGYKLENINLWWHSHNTMDSFFSATDDDTIEKWVNNRFLVAIVGNKAGSFKGKIAIKKPIPCIIDDETLKFVDDCIIVRCEGEEYPKELDAKIKKEVKKKIKEERFETTNYFSNQTTIFKPAKKKTKEEKQQERDQKNWREKNWAFLCDCKLCQMFIDGELPNFQYKAHIWNSQSKMFMPNNPHLTDDYDIPRINHSY